MVNKIMREEALSLEGDGVVPKIYSMLSYKDPTFGTMPSVFLPDTVIFSFNMPETWYFGNKKGVLRKLKINTTLENIEKSFLRNVPKCGIVAQYIAYGSPSLDETKQLTFMYIKKEEFHDFLYNDKPNGILQKFVNPKGPHNFVMKVNWSANFCLFEKIENLRELDDDRTDLYQRAMTVEGKDYQIRNVPIRGDTLPNKLQKLAHSVSQHIRNATIENVVIARMSLVFKVDDNDRIWFMFCSSLRVQPFEDQVETNRLSFGTLVKPENFSVALASPQNVNASKTLVLKARSLKKTAKCRSCNKDLDQQDTLRISMKQAITAFEEDRIAHHPKSLLQSTKPVKKYGIINVNYEKPEEIDVVESTIPKIVFTVYPDLKQKDYRILRNEPGFLYRSIEVCENCYLKFSTTYEFVKNSDTIGREFRKFQPKGTGDLRPEYIEQRRSNTRQQLRRSNDRFDDLLDTFKLQSRATTASWNTRMNAEGPKLQARSKVRSQASLKRPEVPVGEYDALHSVMNKNSWHRSVEHPIEDVEEEETEQSIRENLNEHDRMDFSQPGDYAESRNIAEEEKFINFEDKKYAFTKDFYLPKERKQHRIRIESYNTQSLSTANTVKNLLNAYGQTSVISPGILKKKKVRINSFTKTESGFSIHPLPTIKPIKKRESSLTIKAFDAKLEDLKAAIRSKNL